MPGSKTNRTDSAEQGVIYQGLSVQLMPASTGKRTLAYIIDLGIVYALIYFLCIVIFAVFFVILGGFGFVGSFGGIFSDAAGESLKPVTAIVLIMFLLFSMMLILCIYHGYFVYYEYKKGATPGKKVFGLRVISADGARLGLGQCVLRDMMRYVDCLLILPGLLSVILSKRKQRLGDLMAGTLIVHSPHREKKDQFFYITQDEYLYLRDLLHPGEVGEETCRDYLAFAYQRFIAKVHLPDPGLEARWEKFALDFVPQAREKELDRQTVLLFFAEHCFQTVNQ